jgi:hypothetical protein
MTWLASSLGRFVGWFILGGRDADPHVFRRMRFAVVVRLLVVATFGVCAYAFQAAALFSAVAAASFLAASVAYLARRAAAHARLVRAASCPVDDLAGAVAGGASVSRLFPWYALGVLAVAVAAARRGDADGAERALDDLDLEKLDASERRFERAARALAARRRGDMRHAVQHALDAFPTGAPALDEELARMTLENAWHDPTRLSSIATAWDARDQWPDQTTAIGRFRFLIEVKLKRARLDEVPSASRVLLADEAQRLGDRDLVAELEELAQAAADGRHGYRR